MEDFRSSVTNLRKKMYESFLIDTSNLDVLIPASATLESIFRICKVASSRTSATVFTTNFDTIFEALRETLLASAIERRLIDGFQDQRPHHFDLQNYLTPTTTNEAIYYFKLHGSVTWQRNRNSKSIRDLFPTLAREVALLEPVISKQTSGEEPFASLYKIFERVLAKNKVSVFIGFSFRDDRVREVITRRLEGPRPFSLIIVAPEDKIHPQLNEHLERLAAKANVKWIKGFWGTSDAEAEVIGKITTVA